MMPATAAAGPPITGGPGLPAAGQLSRDGAETVNAASVTAMTHETDNVNHRAIASRGVFVSQFWPKNTGPANPETPA
jgi:hypothetical protein